MKRGLREPPGKLLGSSLGSHRLNTESDSPALPVTGCETRSQDLTSLSLGCYICEMGNDRTLLMGLQEGFREA